jgi:hypothetical protein
MGFLISGVSWGSRGLEGASSTDLGGAQAQPVDRPPPN